MPSNAEIDRLGERFRKDPTDITTLGDLFRHCQEVKQKTQSVLDTVSETTSRKISPRDGKSFKSISEKLNRLEVKLSGMQDIEGCRIIVDSVMEQDLLLFNLRGAFGDTRIYDRRRTKGTGYRAVHLVARMNGARYEIQIRTLLQHSWAEVSVRLAERYGPELRYGGTPASKRAQELAEKLSDEADQVGLCEEVERTIWELWTGLYEGPLIEAAEAIHQVLGDARFGEIDLGAFDDEPRGSPWAERAQRRLGAYKQAISSRLLELSEL